jgi:hypothetical protein
VAIQAGIGMIDLVDQRFRHGDAFLAFSNAFA